MKRCATCKTMKDEEEFNWRNQALGIRHPTCRECQKSYRLDWYVKHKAEHLQNVKARKHEVRKEARQYVWNYLLAHPCTKCGESDPVVLEFHHLYEKDKTISVMIADGWSIDRIQMEMNKCIVLCANCHRRITAKEQRWFRS